MSCKKRFRIQVTVSCKSFPYNRFCQKLSPLLSKDFGGATFEQIEGCWSEDADDLRDSYTPSEEVERGARITLTVLIKDKERALYTLRQHLIATKNQLNLNIRWVHTELEEVEVAHHSI